MSSMEINSVLAQMRSMSVQATGMAVESESSNPASFSTMLSQSIEAVNNTQQKAGALSEAFIKGETDASLAEVMVSLQKSNLSFQTVVQTRNKLVDAYKEVMRMSM